MFTSTLAEHAARMSAPGAQASTTPSPSADAPPWRPGRPRFAPRQFLAELLAKKWMESVFPALVLVLLIAATGLLVENYLSLQNLSTTSRAFAEFGFVALAMALVVISGGIDLSVGAVFAAANMTALLLLNLLQWPVAAVIPVVVLMGAALGAVNGVLIGYVKTRPFLTTLVSLIVIRAAVNLLDERYSRDLAASVLDDATWRFLGEGSLFGLPSNVLLLIALAAVGHLLLSRSRWGWHAIATGGDRRAALHAGIDIRRVLFVVYTLAGALAALGGVLYAARLDSASSNTGRGYEIMALTAVVLGGVSLGGGRGTVSRALIGAGIILVLSNAMVRLGVSGDAQSLILGAIVLLAVGADVRWNKNRFKALDALYVSPVRLELPPPQALARDGSGAATVWAINDELRDALPITFGDHTGGPGDVIFDRQGRLYVGLADGWIMRCPDVGVYRQREFWCRTGGWPLGMQFDRDDRLVVCVAGRGLFSVDTDGEARELTSQTTRAPLRLRDDSRIRVPTTVDIAPDGTIYLADATARYDVHNWVTDALEGGGNGSLICHDPASGRTRTLVRDLPFPAGLVVAHDGQCLYLSSSWTASVLRYWLQGPKRGQLEPFIDNLPGYPGHMNRASDGGYWLCLFGIRAPAFDVAMRHPDFRRRMVRQLPRDEWMMPNLHAGCVVKFDAQGRIVQTLWDPLGRVISMITSVREERGYLYLGSLGAFGLGQKELLSGVDRDWNGVEAAWGKRGDVVVPRARDETLATHSDDVMRSIWARQWAEMKDRA